MNAIVKAVIVDDELINIKSLSQKITQLFPNIDIVGTFQKVEEAIKQIPQLKPQIVFLDIQMPRINGFELLKRLPSIDFQVIFVTAYDSYAIKAFKVNAVDYVLKPIDNDDLKYAISKAIDHILTNQNSDQEQLIQLLTSHLNSNNRLLVPTTTGMSFLKFEDILHLEGDDGYTKFHLANKETLLSSYNLGKFHQKLGSSFFKCHKSHIVNSNEVLHFENEGYLVLSNNTRVPVSKAHRKSIIEWFET